VTLTVSHATPTRKRAHAPLVPIRILAIHCAQIGVALLHVFQFRANGICTSVRYGPTAGHGTGAALLAAFSEVAPVRRKAVVRTSASIALLVFVEVFAVCHYTLRASVLRSMLHLARSLLDALVARHRAIAPSRERLHDAVFGACMVVANTSLAEGGTRLPAVGSFQHDGASTRLEASTTRPRATAPFRIVADLTIHLAMLDGARDCLRERGTLVVIGAVRDNRALALPCTGSASPAALTPGSKRTHGTMIRTLSQVALNGLEFHSARLATELRAGEFRASPGRGAGTA